MLSARHATRYSLAAVGIIATTALLYYTSRHNYLLFHTVVELASITIGFLVFIVMARMFPLFANTYLMFIGIGFVFASVTDTAHMMAYKGMGVFPGKDANLPTQLWIFARYLQSAVVLGATLDLPKKRRRWWPLALLVGTVTLAGLAFIFHGAFPAAYIEGKGLTRFKIFSEYMISLFLVTSLVVLTVKRRYLDRYTFGWIAAALVLSIASELSFTLYVNVYGLSNMMGHFFKMAAYAALLLAVLHNVIILPVRALRASTAICARCKAVREESGTWVPIETVLSRQVGGDVTHGLCPSCMRELYPEYIADSDDT